MSFCTAVNEAKRWRRSEIMELRADRLDVLVETYSNNAGITAIRVTDLTAGHVRSFTRDGNWFVETVDPDVLR